MTALEPHVHRSFGHAEMAASGTYAGEIQIPHRDGAQRSLVLARLLTPGGPSAVIRAVSKTRVQAVNGVIERRPLAHVCQKTGERSVPPLAHRDAAPSVTGIVLGGRVRASALHPEPYSVGRAGARVTLMSMPQRASSFRHVTCIKESAFNSKEIQ